MYRKDVTLLRFFIPLTAGVASEQGFAGQFNSDNLPGG